MQMPNAQGLAGLMPQGKPPGMPQSQGQQPPMPSPMKASPMAGLGSVEDRVSAYRGNPAPLQQRYAMTQDLLDLLALQQLTSEKEAVKRAMEAKMAQQKAANGEDPNATIAEKVERKALDLTKNELAQQRGETAQQQAKEMSSSGIAQAPGAQMAAQPSLMASGGIVAFNEGGSPASRWVKEQGKEATESQERIRLQQEIMRKFGDAAGPLGFFRSQTNEQRQHAKDVLSKVGAMSVEEMKQVLADGTPVVTPTPVPVPGPAAAPATRSPVEIALEKTHIAGLGSDGQAGRITEETRVQDKLSFPEEQARRRVVMDEAAAEHKREFGDTEKERWNRLVSSIAGSPATRYGGTGLANIAAGGIAYDDRRRAERGASLKGMEASEQGLFGLHKGAVESGIKSGADVYGKTMDQQTAAMISAGKTVEGKYTREAIALEGVLDRQSREKIASANAAIQSETNRAMREQNLELQHQRLLKDIDTLEGRKITAVNRSADAVEAAKLQSIKVLSPTAFTPVQEKQLEVLRKRVDDALKAVEFSSDAQRERVTSALTKGTKDGFGQLSTKPPK